MHVSLVQAQLFANPVAGEAALLHGGQNLAPHQVDNTPVGENGIAQLGADRVGLARQPTSRGTPYTKEPTANSPICVLPSDS